MPSTQCRNHPQPELWPPTSCPGKAREAAKADGGGRQAQRARLQLCTLLVSSFPRKYGRGTQADCAARK